MEEIRNGRHCDGEIEWQRAAGADDVSQGCGVCGGSVTLANGTVRRDLVRTAAARKYALAWSALTTAQKATLESAWAAAVAGEVSFESPDGDNTTVTAPPDARLSFEAYQSQNSLLWKSAVELWEV
jgi:hypothetical protein